MTSAAAIILAGGKGERLGGAVKATLRVGGMRLIDRVIAAVAEADPILIANGRVDPADFGRERGWAFVPDAHGDVSGPLAGLAGGIAWLAAHDPRPDFVLSVAVDTPFFPAAFLKRAIEQIGGAGAAVARHGRQDYPTNALWRFNAVVDLAERVAAGTSPGSLKRLLASVGAVAIDWREEAGGDPFANVNTHDDLAALRARAQA
jgi:molybdopterin-guanine dinucleotide biosynthesis protein A